MYVSDVGGWIAIGTAVLFLSPFAARELSFQLLFNPTSTHQGASLATTKQVRRDELVVFCLFLIELDN